MNKILTAFVRNTVFANLLLVMVMAAGLGGMLMMVREVLPSFAVESIIVRVPYPGAGPEEVEEGISLKIEDAIESVQGIKKFTTTSAEGMATAVIDIKTGADVQVVKDRVTDRINAIQTFPDDAEKPTISELIIERDTIAVSIAGDLPEHQLKELAEDVRDDLTQLPDVSSVVMIGARDYEISIEVSEETLRRYGLTFDEVSRIVGASSQNVPGGQLRSSTEEISIRTMGRNYTGKEFADIVLISRADGTSLRLGDIAKVRDDFVEDPLITRFEEMPAVTLMVRNAEDEDAMDIAAAIKGYVERKNAELTDLGLQDRVQLHTWLDTSTFIVQRIDMLLSNGMIGLILVFLLLWAFLDLRLAVWVSMGIPISLAGAMFLMFVLGETINMISLFAMIMVLGIIVDDAIVIGESIYFHRKLGKPPIRAAVDGAMEVTMPVFAAVITTVVAFVPLLFVEGVMGKFIKVIPTVVICALLVSLVEALIILPAHLNHLPDMNEKPHNPGMIKKFLEFVRTTFNHGLVRFVDKFYRPMLAFLLSWRYVSLAGAIAVLFMTFGLVQGGFIKFVFFPEVDTSFVFARIEFPEGTSIEVTRDAILRMEKALDEMVEETPTESGEPMVVAMQSSIGMQLQTQKKGANVGEILVEFLDSEERGVHFRDIVRKWEEKLGPVPGAISVAIDGESGGPPGKPIEVWLLGKDIDMLRAASEDLKETLRQYAGVFQIEDDFRPGKREVRARLKPEARSLGLTSGDLARQLRQGFYGAEVLRVQRGRDEVKVWVRYPIEQRRTMADIERVRIRTPRGEEVPLASVADVSVENGYTTINRKDGLRRVSVSADVFSEVTNATDVLAMVQRDFLETLPTKYPGVTSSLEGEKRELVESMSSLFIGFPLAILGIYLIIATLFRSYLQPIVIMITVPFGLIGAVLGHMAMGFSLTIMSMFGMVALAGVVVNDAIVMIEAVNDRLAAGMSLADSIVDGGARRFRAILLTTATTVGGLAPLIVETSMQAQFLIPMAITIAAGVAFATLLTLVVIPCLLFILNDIRRGIYFLRHGRHCTPEHVEPATRRNVSDEDYFEEGNEEGMTAGSSNTSPAT